MKSPLIILFAAAFAFLLSACQTGETKKPVKTTESNRLFADIRIDSLHPAGLEELNFNSSGDTVYGFSYLANGRGPHPTVVLLHGLPGNERNLDVAQHLRRNGYNVVFFNYRGSWGSQGKFSYENSLQDVNAVLDHITDPENKERLRVDARNIFLFGHSMGAGLALITGLKDPRVKGVLGVSLFNPYSAFQGKAANVNVIDLGAYVSGLGMLNTTPQEYLKGILKNVESYDIEKMIDETKKPVLIIDEHELNGYLKKYARRRAFDYERWNTDIAFTDKRIALATRTEKWLDSKTKKR